MRCIYCTKYDGELDKLSREHIIPQTLGGELILHNASCAECAKLINQQIETPVLTQFLKTPRTHLGMPTSRPPQTLPIGRWTAPTGELPKDMADVDFRFDQIPVSDHSFCLILPVFAPPDILWNKPPSEMFIITKIQGYTDGRPNPPSTPNEQTAEFQPFSPDIFLRFIAKIAHGAVIAELGLDSFSPLLPDIILGKSRYISHLVGNTTGKRVSGQNNFQHKITVVLRLRYIVAIVHLFKVPHPYIAVVGRPREDLTSLHTSALICSAIIA
jgi:HNH endonuclease